MIKRKFFQWRKQILSITIIVLSLLNINQAKPQELNITIHNREPAEIIYIRRTEIKAGHSIGDILNYHYFPGLKHYRHGNYQSAKKELDYFINRPQYTSMNPRQSEFFSTAHYLRGRIYFYHASGAGRQLLAKNDFEKSIQWDPNNHLSYLELSRVWLDIGNNNAGFAVLKRLLELEPEDKIVQQAKKLFSSK